MQPSAMSFAAIAPATGDSNRSARVAAAYLQQGRSDFDIYKKLVDVPECHRLHYLQMACEKIAKAYRLRDTQTSLEENLLSFVRPANGVTTGKPFA
jgi:hypothetical protein